MINLDSLEEIKKLDKGKALESITQFPQQCEQALKETLGFVIPPEYNKVSNVVVAGMGGSAYAARIVKSLFLINLTKPIELITGYDLPEYVNNNSLVFLSSFSGTTEETLTIGKIAKEKGAKIAGITSGGNLAGFLRENNYPAYIFNPKHNPSQQPRLGQGYMVVGSLMLMLHLGLIYFNPLELESAIKQLSQYDINLNPSKPQIENVAKKLVQKLVNRYPILFSGDIFEGTLHAIRNPFNETSKQFAAYFSIPELNHHLMEGFSFPVDNKEKLFVVIFDSDLYSSKIKKRIEITKDVLNKNSIPYHSIKLKGEKTVTQMLELLQLGAYTTFYLGMLNGVDPAKIPWVDYFKSQLAK